MKNAEDFKKAAINKNITKWDISKCICCGKSYGFVFSNNFEDVHKNSCDCVPMKYLPVSCVDWYTVCRHYNLQESPDYKKKMDEFWGFK